MNIVMSSIDHNIANLEVREKFSLTNSAMSEIYQELKSYDDISGCVIISTCNRTEIYLSMGEEAVLNPFEVLCEMRNVDMEPYQDRCITKENDEAVHHLCEVACGLRSQIWGEDQILSQVKNALAFARECGATDSVLEVLFRNAISAAKKVKTTVVFKNFEDNASKRAANIVKNQFPNGKVLVIGNGAAGRSVCEFLLEQGISVTMTKRTYKHSDNIIPAKAETIEYAARYEQLSRFDACVSATMSPHHTITYDKIIHLEKIPKLFIDLAVPRDIDPKIEQMDGILYYNIDDISQGAVHERHKIQMVQVNQILEKYIHDFYHWCSYKENKVGVV